MALPIAPILVADDMSAETPQDAKRSLAVRSYGKYFAELLKAPIEFIHVEDSRRSLATLAFYGAEGKESVWRLDPYRPGYPEVIRRFILDGVPAKEIIRISNKKPKAQLIVTGSHGRTGLKRLLLGSVAEKVIAASRVPVAILGPKIRVPKNNPFARAKHLKLLVPTDLSPTGRRFEAYAMTLAKKIGASVTLLHSPFGDYGFYEKLGARIKKSGKLELDIQKALQERQKTFLKHRVPCRIVIDRKTVFTHEAIIKAVPGHSMIIMGTHSRSAISKTFIGGTTREIVAKAPVPVITLGLAT